MTSVTQKTERRREQNRRAQANLRRKRQEEIEDLQQQVSSLKAQAQVRTEDALQSQRADPGESGHHGQFPQLYDGYNNNQQAGTDVFHNEEGWPTSHSSIPQFDPCPSYVQPPPPPIPSYQPPISTNAPIAPRIFAQQQYHCAFDALAKNACLLGVSPEMFLSTNSTSIFYCPLQSLASITASIRHLPMQFHPTMAQLSYSHQPWIDCIPLSDLRSRIIFAVSHRPPLLDSLDLWHDVLSNGLSCVADPMDARAWTMSDEFVQKWRMLLRIDLPTLEMMCLASNPPVRKMYLPGSYAA